jgi:prepilin peptidase CpaA
MVLVCLAILAALLLIGAAIDIKSRRIPNWLTAGVAGLYALYVVVAPVSVDWLGASAVAGTTFIIGFALFAFNLMGGGDVKLMSGLALWAGVDLAALFLLVTGLAGGVMALGILLFRRFVQHPLVVAFWPMALVMIEGRLGITFPGKGLGSGTRHPEEDPTAGSLPYGVAIAAGGFVVICALLKL